MEARIISTAVDLFTTQGIDATSLQMIADTLGITKGTVCSHFKTKHEIVLAVSADSFEALEAAVTEAETIESVSVGPRPRARPPSSRASVRARRRVAQRSSASSVSIR